jgi:hypothetical protein
MNESMSENRKYKVRCVVYGSKPPPIIDWFIGGQKIESTYTKVPQKSRMKNLNLNYFSIEYL